MEPILTKKTRRYLIPRMIFGKIGRKFFVSVFILIAVRADVLNDQRMLRSKNIRAVFITLKDFLEPTLHRILGLA